MRPILFLLLTFFLVVSCKSADEDYSEYEDEPAPITPAPARTPNRPGSLLSRNRIPPRKPPTVSTTPKVVEQPVEEEFSEDEEVVDESLNQEEPSTTTTEATKKLRTGGGVRPFRSNEELLAILKRRRAQAGSHTKEPTSTQSPTESTTSKSKSTSGTRNKNSANEASPKSSSTRGRFGGSKSKFGQEEFQETQRDEVQVNPKPFRRTG